MTKPIQLQAIKRIAFCLMIGCVLGFSTLYAQLNAAFTYRWLVNPSCVQPEELYVLELSNQSTGPFSQIKWVTAQPQMVRITTNTIGASFVSLDISKGTLPSNLEVALLIQDTTGNIDSTSQSISLNLLHYAPVVKFSDGLSVRGCEDDAINFGQNTFSLHGTSLTDYDWDFGDNSTSTSQSPSHTYSDPGTYQVSLKVTDATGCIGGNHFSSYKLRAKIRASSQCQ